jgi:heme A synthase
MLRRWSYAAITVAVTHMIFGAIVRISGSGMGCGDHWPRCYGSWLPPFSQPTVVIEWTHRLLASVLVVAVTALVIAAARRRDQPGVGGTGGVLRPALLALGLVIGTALFGMVTVKLGNAPLATVAHWLLAASTLAALAAAAIRTGGFGALARDPQANGASSRAFRGARAAAVLALITVTFGGLTAKLPGANVACRGFPLCTQSAVLVPGEALYVHLTHRILGILLLLHVTGITVAMSRRHEPGPVLRMARIALGLLVAQVVIAAAMVSLDLPPVLRSLHQSVGVGVWLALFSLAYLARPSSRAAGLDRLKDPLGAAVLARSSAT